jgi:regulator of nonsense transcripts 1
LKGRKHAIFAFRSPEAVGRVVPGDELRLVLPAVLNRGVEWASSGHVLGYFDEEVTLELRSNAGVPEELHGYSVEFNWNSVTFDRMQQAMKTFAVDDTSVSGYV